MRFWGVGGKQSYEQLCPKKVALFPSSTEGKSLDLERNFQLKGQEFLQQQPIAGGNLEPGATARPQHHPHPRAVHFLSAQHSWAQVCSLSRFFQTQGARIS